MDARLCTQGQGQGKRQCALGGGRAYYNELLSSAAPAACMFASPGQHPMFARRRAGLRIELSSATPDTHYSQNGCL